MNDFLEDHGLTLIASIVGIGIIATQAPAFMAKQASDKVKNDIATAANVTNDRLSVEALKRKDRQAIANSRYETGCEVVSELRKPDVAATLREGEPIVIGSRADEFGKSRLKGLQLKDLKAFYWNTEQVFCDFYGVSAVTRYDPSKGYYVASDIATTTDTEAIQKVRSKFPQIFKPNTTKGN
jgi:hypothetical protein